LTFRPPSHCDPPAAALEIIEHADRGLGAHVWDASLALSLHLLSLHNNNNVTPSPPHAPEQSPPPPSPSKVIELGSGCALVSLVSALVWPDASSIICTDLEPVIDLATLPNLARNLPSQADNRVHAKVLDWNDSDTADQLGLSSSSSCGDRVALLAADVLYNPSSHTSFLRTVLSLLSTSPRNSFCLLAYRKRMDGDDGFFEMARGAGLSVEQVGGWGDVSIWRLERSTGTAVSNDAAM
jgi:hypothetical protein